MQNIKTLVCVKWGSVSKIVFRASGLREGQSAFKGSGLKFRASGSVGGAKSFNVLDFQCRDVTILETQSAKILTLFLHNNILTFLRGGAKVQITFYEK